MTNLPPLGPPRRFSQASIADAFGMKEDELTRILKDHNDYFLEPDVRLKALKNERADLAAKMVSSSQRTFKIRETEIASGLGGAFLGMGAFGMGPTGYLAGGVLTGIGISSTRHLHRYSPNKIAIRTADIEVQTQAIEAERAKLVLHCDDVRTARAATEVMEECSLAAEILHIGTGQNAQIILPVVEAMGKKFGNNLTDLLDTTDLATAHEVCDYLAPRLRRVIGLARIESDTLTNASTLTLASAIRKKLVDALIGQLRDIHTQACAVRNDIENFANHDFDSPVISGYKERVSKGANTAPDALRRPISSRNVPLFASIAPGLRTDPQVEVPQRGLN